MALRFSPRTFGERIIMVQTEFQNLMIQLMATEDFEAFRRHLEPVEFSPRQILVQRNAVVAFIYFPEAGQLSVLGKLHGSDPMEVAMMGREGMTNMAPAHRVPLETIVQVAGHGHRLSRQIFADRMATSAKLTLLESQWQHTLMLQIAFAALAHSSRNVEERLARYLLMVHDRVDGDDLPIVHEYVAWMLGVRRAGITAAVGSLRAAGAIETRRGLMRVVQRQLLLDRANGSYGQPEAEYEQIFKVNLSSKAGSYQEYV
jgi:CRP-like cAMP-binding protein